MVDTSKIIWKNDQWAVTTYGIEALEPFPYHIDKTRLNERRPTTSDIADWPLHLAEKTWVNLGSFMEAFRQAIKIHKVDMSGIDLEASEVAAWEVMKKSR